MDNIVDEVLEQTMKAIPLSRRAPKIEKKIVETIDRTPNASSTNYTVSFKRPFGTIGEGTGTPLTWGLSKFIASLREWIEEQSRFQEKVKDSVHKSGGVDKIVKSIESYARADDHRKAKNLLLKIGYLSSDHRIEFSTPSGGDTIVVSHHIPDSQKRAGDDMENVPVEECRCGCDVCKKKNGKRTYERNLREDVAILLAVREACLEDPGCITEVYDSDGLIVASFGDETDLKEMFASEMGVSWDRFVVERRDAIASDRDTLLRAWAADLIEHRVLFERSRGKSEMLMTSLLKEASGRSALPHLVLKEVFHRGVASWKETSFSPLLPIELGLDRVSRFVDGHAELSDQEIYERWVR